MIDPGPIPSWVKVETVRAVVAVWCSRCRAWDALYHVVAVKDPRALRRAVAKHQGCKA